MYNKTIWVDPIVDEHGNIIESGTLITADRLNNMEVGIGNAYSLDNLDCGFFDDCAGVIDAYDFGYFESMGEVEMHNMGANAHRNLNVDGNVVLKAAEAVGLANHAKDANAHQNLIIDGNVREV